MRHLPALHCICNFPRDLKLFYGKKFVLVKTPCLDSVPSSAPEPSSSIGSWAVSSGRAWKSEETWNQTSCVQALLLALSPSVSSSVNGGNSCRRGRRMTHAWRVLCVPCVSL